MTSTTGPQIVKLIIQHIIYHFDIPLRITIDNGTSFKNQHMQYLF